MKRQLLAVPAALILSVSAFAHNGMEHIMGTVSSMSASMVVVKAQDGKLTPVLTDAKTMWMRGKAMITAKDIHTGDRVVIHAKKVGATLLAAEVEAGPAAHAH